MLRGLSKWAFAGSRLHAALPTDAVRFFARQARRPGAAPVAVVADASSSTSFQLQVIIKSFSLKSIQQASVAVRDLLLLNFAPKSKDVLPSSHSSKPGSNLVMSVGDMPIRQRVSRYTVLRSPHVDKKSREQFQKVVHKRIINISTVSASELHWFMQHLKMYEFLGVQIQVNVTSRNYLVPPAEVRTGSLLSQHRSECQSIYAKAALEPRTVEPQRLIQEAIDKLQNTLHTASSSDTPLQVDAKQTMASTADDDFKALLDASKSVLLSLDTSALNNSKLLQARFGAVSCQQDDVAAFIHNLMKLGLWLNKVNQLTGAKDAQQAEELKSFAEAACQTLLEAYMQRQLYGSVAKVAGAK